MKWDLSSLVSKLGGCRGMLNRKPLSHLCCRTLVTRNDSKTFCSFDVVESSSFDTATWKH